MFCIHCEPAWPSGLGVSTLVHKQQDLGFDSASALLSLQKRLWSVDTVLFVTLSLTIRVSRGTSVRFRFGSPLSSKVVVCGYCLVCDFVPHYYGKQRDLGSIPLRLSSLFKRGCGLWTLSCDFVPHY